MEHVLRRFNSHDEYLTFLTNNTTCTEPKYTASHEKEHIDMATSLGYKAVYGVQYVGNDFPHIFLGAFTDFPDKEPTPDHLIKILLAPSEPGKQDLARAKKFRKELE